MNAIGVELMSWDFLRALGWLGLTIAIYLLARRIQDATKGNPLANTVSLAALSIMVVLKLWDVPVDAYQQGGFVLLWILGPATVALAIPLYMNFSHVRAAWLPMATALVVGSVVAVVSSVAIGYLLGASIETVRSLAPKTVTTPIAMGIAQSIGGIPALTAAFVIFTGIIGAVSASALFKIVHVRDPRARGFALGVSSGGIGTAHAFQESLLAGTFSGVGMTLNGIFTAIWLPIIWLLFF